MTASEPHVASTPTQGNRLGGELSPYLLQHAGNPVHWRPWGSVAFDEARREDKPILLSVGYAACHWCHVMAHESFEDPAVADLMNRLYVPVKVDREERPDIDHLYMSALHALGEQGGWPLTMFLTPDGDPFWGGTYFPPTARWGRPSFRQVLVGVADAFRSQAEGISGNAASLSRALKAMSATRPGDRIGPDRLADVARRLLLSTDPVNGGFQGAPKFPSSPSFRFLWSEACRTSNEDIAGVVRLELLKMSQGGIYDHLGGGYARYSTDDVWLVPHFEKMLYDNVQILEMIALAYASQPDPILAERAAETVGWMERDMRAETSGGRAAFCASEDADSEGEEGLFYVWSEAEVDALLGPDSASFKAAYDVTPGGNWEGRTILRRLTSRGDATAENALARSRATLFAARTGRVRPGLDDKVLADWNGLAVAALCRAAAVFRRSDWLARAAEAFDFVRTEMSSEDGRVQHAWRRGRVTAAGLLDDQAAMARAALALFEATGDVARLDQAKELADAAATWFVDADGSYFATASDATDVPFGPAGRPRTAGDNATPSGTGLMAEVLARLYHLTGDDIWRERADRLIAAFSGLGDHLVGAPTLLAAADLLDGGTLVVVAGAEIAMATHDLLAVALAAPDPAIAVLRAGGAAALPASHPAFGKTAPPGGAVAFVCRGGVCGLPIDDPVRLAAVLARRGGLAGSA